MTGPHRFRLLAALVAAGALALAGCDAEVSVGETTVDTDEAETQIAAGLTEQVGEEITVECPDDVEAEAGGTFTCEAADAAGEIIPVDVEQTDDDGNIRWSLRTGG